MVLQNITKIISSILVKEISNNNKNRKITKVEEEIHNSSYEILHRTYQYNGTKK